MADWGGIIGGAGSAISGLLNGTANIISAKNTAKNNTTLSDRNKIKNSGEDSGNSANSGDSGELSTNMLLYGAFAVIAIVLVIIVLRR